MAAAEGTRLWISDEERSFVEAEVVRQQADGSLVVRNTETGVESIIKSAKDMHFSNPEVEGGYDDMTNLNHLHEAAILHNLLTRFRSDIVYTYSGRTCISVNPFKWLNLYGDEKVELYKSAEFGELPPHVFAVAQLSYKEMKKTLKSQSILVSGESGAGKTEATKLLLKFIANAARGDNTVSITEQVLQSNPLLESFGNAKTLRNDNSSRFGKFIELQFDEKNFIIGAKTQTYLLEKSRVVHVSKGERNYHIFYQLLAGADEKLRGQLRLTGGPQDYFYLNQSPCFELPEVSDKKDFEITLNSMRVVGITESEMTSSLKVLSAILHLGQLKFIVRRRQEDSASIENEDMVDTISYLLSVPKDKLIESLCFRRISTRSETYSKPNNLEQALGARDALSKHLYGRLFDWIVDRINRTTRRDEKTARFIGILDIFGFECFEKNSFEQLCINYANEKLQQQYTRDVFKTVQEEYEAEKIPWSHIDFIDNQECLNLIESKVGLLALLNEECIMPKGSDANLLNKLKTVHDGHKNLVKSKKMIKGFIVGHYAGEVIYDVDNFLEKNKDTLVPDLILAVKQSTDSFIAQLITFSSNSNVSFEGSSKIGSRDNFIASQFKHQLNSLMETIGKTTVNYVRCIKPNTSNKPNIFQNIYAAHQLRYAGVLEAIRISRSAYPNRLSFTEFLERFKILTHRSKWKSFQINPKNSIEEILKVAFTGGDKYTIGLTRVYFRFGCLEELEHLRSGKVTQVVIFLQKHIRGWLAKKDYSKMRYSAVKIQAQWRTRMQKQKYKQIRSSVIKLQSFVRMLAAIKRAKETLRRRAATRIQKAFKGFIQRRKYIALKKAVIIVQSIARMRHHRKKYLSDIHEAREARKIVNQLAMMQQRLQEEMRAKAALEEEKARLRQKLTTQPTKPAPKPKPARAQVAPSAVVPEPTPEIEEQVVEEIIEEVEYEDDVDDEESVGVSQEDISEPTSPIKEYRPTDGVLQDADVLLSQMKAQLEKLNKRLEAETEMKQHLEEANRTLEEKLKNEELKGQIEVNSRKGVEVKILHEIRQKEEAEERMKKASEEMELIKLMLKGQVAERERAQKERIDMMKLLNGLRDEIGRLFESKERAMDEKRNLMAQLQKEATLQADVVDDLKIARRENRDLKQTLAIPIEGAEDFDEIPYVGVPRKKSILESLTSAFGIRRSSTQVSISALSNSIPKSPSGGVLSETQPESLPNQK